ncbi:MAG: hypothetical protein AB7F78_11810, partial [Hyphomicrobiaceae bacterium]
MPLQNRVTPEGEIVADAARGLMMGNRGGALHDDVKRLGRRRWVSRQWICCRLAFNGRHREVMSPGRYTELFFLDEPTALAAGHRPCFECRRQDFLRFATLWAKVLGGDGRATAPDMDEVLQRERVDAAGRKLTCAAPFADLPSGSFVRFEGRPHLVLGSRLLEWTPRGSQKSCDRPRQGQAEVLSPP